MFTIAALFAMSPLTWMGAVRIANVAHFSGLAYGWIAGGVWFGESSRPALRGTFAALHLLLVPATIAATQPWWNGRYHWYVADQATDESTRISHFQEAVRRDPALPRVWIELAAHHRSRGDRLRAWEVLLTGLRHNRSHEDLLRMARTMWLQLQSERERTEGMEIIDRVFRDESLAWQSRLGARPELVQHGSGAGGASEALSDEERYSLDQRIVLPPALDGSDALPVREQQLPPIDPEHPTSAAEGVTL